MAARGKEKANEGVVRMISLTSPSGGTFAIRAEDILAIVETDNAPDTGNYEQAPQLERKIIVRNHLSIELFATETVEQIIELMKSRI